MKSTIGTEETPHTPEESILEKYKKHSSRNTYSVEILTLCEVTSIFLAQGSPSRISLNVKFLERQFYLSLQGIKPHNCTVQQDRKGGYFWSCSPVRQTCHGLDDLVATNHTGVSYLCWWVLSSFLLSMSICPHNQYV